MSDLVRMAEAEFAEESPACGLVCREHAREAKLIQSSLLPAKELHHSSAEIAFRFLPFSSVGGDFADFFHLPNGHIGIYLGDVVGKGLPAAMYSALVMGTLRGIHKTGTDTAQVLKLLNERLVQRPIPGRFCCALYALFNPVTRELIFSSAGMPRPLVACGASCRPLGEGGLPSGMFSGSTYERHTVQLSPGDCVLFATDGLHELRDAAGIELGAAQMKELWAQCRERSAAESMDFLFDGLLRFAGGRAPHDDIAAIVLKVPA
jgi:sigma-B regulation protein RsbU (phosphoserine phosphatase)